MPSAALATCRARTAPRRSAMPPPGAAAASQGLTMLTDHALKGIRRMPAHGGSTGVSDFELQRAIVYMVNNSGGKWVEPAAVRTSTLTSEAIVQRQCAACHQTGKRRARRRSATAPPGRCGWPRAGPAGRLGRARTRTDALARRDAGPGARGHPRRDPVHVQLRPAGRDAAAVGRGCRRAPQERRGAGRLFRNDARRGNAFRAGASKTGAARLSVPSGRGYYHLNISLEDGKTPCAGDRRRGHPEGV